jgi:CheY-like chemotaxis protein
MSNLLVVVDDDLDVRVALCDLLDYEGYDVACFENGREALAHLRGGSALPGLILLDLVMPVMDGYRFRDEQRRDPRLREVPVIITTAFFPHAELDGAPVLTKPLDPRRILRCVGDLCPA